MDITGIKDQKTLNRYLSVSIDTKTEKLTKMFENLSPKIEPEPNPNADKINALKEALSKKGLNAEDIEDIISQIER